MIAAGVLGLIGFAISPPCFAQANSTQSRDRRLEAAETRHRRVGHGIRRSKAHRRPGLRNQSAEFWDRRTDASSHRAARY